MLFVITTAALHRGMAEEWQNTLLDLSALWCISIIGTGYAGYVLASVEG